MGYFYTTTPRDSKIPTLFLAKGIEIARFRGRDIPGFCSIAIEQKPEDDWPSYPRASYQLSLAPGVTPVLVLVPIDFNWDKNPTSLTDLMEFLTSLEYTTITADIGQAS